jgi:DNA-binding winged helix-turn-helix (wHTH) protein/tetratricopeptide (TPR) repeat protein
MRQAVMPPRLCRHQSQFTRECRDGGSALARSLGQSNPVRLHFGRFDLDEANACLLRDGRAVALAPTPFAVLCALARRPGSLLTKHALLDEVWGHQHVSESVLKTVISELRTVLDDDARQPRIIETVSRRGYRFIAPAAALPAEPSVAAGGFASRAVREPMFIGRAAALQRLQRAWGAARSGKRVVVWVAGEPGIGKTTLIDRFVASLGEVACARGQCVEHDGTGEPYLPVLEALGALCRSDSTLPGLLRAVAPTWLLQLPWLSSADERDALRREVGSASPQRMLREMGEVLDRYTERKPLLLLTEDLHWSDPSTVQLIDYIARRHGGAHLMWLGSFRPAEVVALDHPLNALRHELRLHELCEEIALDPFSEAEVAEYVAKRSPALAGDQAFVHALHERTDGVPLFVASVMSEVAARAAAGGEEAAAAARLADVAVPENLTAVIDHYIAALGNEQRAVLSAAAVCGIEFRASTLAAALERDEAWVCETCEALVREQVWLTAPRGEAGDDAPELPYSFRHALFRQGLYERIAPALRTQLHRKVGAALEGERAAGVAVAPAELAVHFERGREPMAALRYYAEGGEAAILNLVPMQCVALTQRGLNLLNEAREGTERDALEITLATLWGTAATQLLGVTAEAKRAFQRAYDLLPGSPRHPMRRRLLYGLGLLLCLRAEYGEALAVAEHAESLSPSTNDPVAALAACIVHGQVDQLQGRWHAAREWTERGLALVERMDFAPGEIFLFEPKVMLLGLLAIPLLHLGLVEEARERLQQAHARARLVRQPMAQMAAIWYDALFEVRLGNAERVAALADEMKALVEKYGLVHGRLGSRWFRGWADARMGRPLEGYRSIREAYEENARLGMLVGGSETRAYASEALLLARDFHAAQRELEEAFEFARVHRERVYLTELFLLQAAIARERGDSAAAHASIRQALTEARAQKAPWLELMALIELCESEDGQAEDRQALAALMDDLPEARETAALNRARALLRPTPPAAGQRARVRESARSRR